MNDDNIYAKYFFAGLKPELDLTVSEWADKHRILTSISSSEPGPWQTATVVPSEKQR